MRFWLIQGALVVLFAAGQLLAPGGRAQFYLSSILLNFVGGICVGYAFMSQSEHRSHALCWLLVPIVLIAIYLSIVKRLGAFDAL